MQKASKNFDEKRLLIDKIQQAKKKKTDRHLPPDLNKLELPPVIKIIGSPSKKSRNLHPFANTNIHPLTNTITAQFRNSIETELDTIIKDTLNYYQTDNVSKIIFTSPITNRLGRTYYRPNDNSFFDAGRNKHIRIKKQSSNGRPEYASLDLNSSLVAVSKELEKPYRQNFIIKMKEAPEEPLSEGQNYQTLDDSSIKKNREMRMGRTQRLKHLHGKGHDRFSPWKDQQADEQLTL